MSKIKLSLDKEPAAGLGATKGSRKQRIAELKEQYEIDCSRCQPHKRCNAKRHKTRPDKYKDSRKGK